MAITNGYVTLAQCSAYMWNDQDSVNAGDDAVIEDLVEKASRAIDSHTGRTFYARTETRYYDTPAGATLELDDDLLSITTLTNGDATTIASTSYALLPYNSTPYYAVELYGTDGVWWQVSTTTNSTRKAITIAGSWGYASTAPEDVQLACLMLVRDTYNKRLGETGSGDSLITAAGVMIMPSGFPREVRDLLRSYVRMGS